MMGSRTRTATLAAILAALVAALVFAAPVFAQEVEQQDGVEGEQFQTDETRSANQTLAEHNAEYEQIESELGDLESIDPWDQTDSQQARVEELDDRQSDLESEYNDKVEALVEARIAAIEGAPVQGSPEERLDALQAKQEASEQLQDYASEELSYSSDYSTGFGASDYPDYTDDIESAQADVDAAEEDQGDSGGGAAAPSGSESGNSGSSGGDSGGGGGEMSPAPNGGGDSSLFAKAAFFSVVVVVAASVLFRYSGGMKGGGIGERVRAVLGPRLATAPESAPAPTAKSPTPPAKEQQATPETNDSGGSSGSSDAPNTPGNSEDLLGDADDIARNAGSVDPLLDDDDDDTPGTPGQSEDPPGESDQSKPSDPAVDPEPDPDRKVVGPGAGTRVPSWFEKNARNLTEEARNGEIDEVIGREEEIQRVVDILHRQKKGNPILVGEAGVGKTAIAEGLARLMAAGEAGKGLEGKRLVEVQMGAMVAGTKYRGEFEERLTEVVKEASDGSTILFIDEVHTIMGGGAGEGATDAAQILKPALARSTFRLLGATTREEYRKHIEADGAVERRCNPVTVEEMSVADTTTLLHRVQGSYGGGKVEISDEALSAAAEYSHKYIPDRRLPDKAIDLVDECSARAQSRGDARVGEPEIRALIKRQTGIDPGAPDAFESERLADLEQRLSERVIGQPEAVSTVARAVASSRYMPDESKPVSMLFAGPSGVGKTELAKALASEQYGSEDAMVRLDMSEYGEKHSVTNLIGAARGYVGSDKGGDLSEPVRQRPYSVVLLDEIEKAHPDILTPLLAVLDDGRLTDNQGRVVSFKNALIVMTTNAGAEQIAAASGAGEPPPVDDVKQALQEHGLRPEWIGRVGYICPYAPLSEAALQGIAEKALQGAAEKAAKNSITLTWTEAAVDLIADLGASPAFGARPLNQVVQAQVVEGLTTALMSQEIKPGDTAVVEALLSEERVVIRRANGDDPDSLNALFDASPDADTSPEEPGDGEDQGPRRRKRRPPEDSSNDPLLDDDDDD